METEDIPQVSQQISLPGILGIVVVTLFMIMCVWKVFVKAGQPGWASLVPIYNLIVMLKVAGKPFWWFFLCIIPFVNFVVLILVPIGIAKRFGKGVGFGLGLLILPIIFYPILAFGDATYQGDTAPPPMP